MSSYRVYKVGEDEHVREAEAAAPSRDGGSRRRRRAGAPAAAPRRWWIWALVAAAAVAAALLYWFYGREAVGNSRAALDIVNATDKVPGWAVLGAPVVVVAAVALVTAYLAFGRHLAFKLVGVAVVVVVLATPGLAVGYANGLVSDVGAGTGSAARTDEESAQIAAGRPGDRPADPQQADEHPAHRLRQEHGPRRPRALGHADARAPRPADEEHLDALPAARPAGRHPRRRPREDERGLLLRRAHARHQDLQAAHGPADQRLDRGQLRRVLARRQHPRRRLPADRPQVLRPGERGLQVDQPGARLPAGARQAGAQLRALPPRPEGRLHAHAAPAVVPQGGAAPVRPLEQRLDQGAQADQGHHRRDQVEPELAQEDPAAGGACVPGRHLEGLPGAPGGRRRR